MGQSPRRATKLDSTTPAKPATRPAGKLTELSALQSENLTTILSELDEMRNFCTETVQVYCSLLDGFVAMRTARKALRRDYLRAQARLGSRDRRLAVAEKLGAAEPPAEPEDDLEPDLPPGHFPLSTNRCETANGQ